MVRQQWRHRLALGWRLLVGAPALAGSIPLVAVAQDSVPAADRLPARLSDADFWALVDSISEPGGYFQIQDNFTSNEREIGQLFTMLRERGTRGGVYMGVGPEQNLTYIAAIRPQMAFIVDIRRQAVVQHLMFKAVFEMAADRADFISILFSRRRPPGLDSSTTIQAMWEAYWNVPSDSAMWQSSYARIVELLTQAHGFRLTPDELKDLKHVFDHFFMYGPVITTRAGSGGGGNQTTFADLTGYSNDASGVPRSFLSSEENYAYVKGLHARNLIVPVSGDFAGPRAIRSVGAWLRDRGGIVSAFYVSNVEQYLFREGKAARFYENVATLPVNDESIFIRPYSMRRYGFGIQSLCPIGRFLEAERAGLALDNASAMSCPR
jgi:hypothetical protein